MKIEDDYKKKIFTTIFSRSGWIILLFSWLVYLCNVYRYHLERWDDAYITFRFAKHLADGEGLVWNIGGERVEGFTSLLDVLLLAAGFKVGLDPWTAGLIIGVVSVLATAAMLTFLIRRLSGGLHPAAAILIGIYLIDINTAIHTTSGLETQFFVCLLCACLLCAILFAESKRLSMAIFLGVLIITSCLCRPEAVIYGTALYLSLAIICLRENVRESFLKLSISSGVVILLGMIYVFWKYNYFGYLMPNPYYVKSNKFSFAGINEVFDFLKHIAKLFAPVLLAAMLFAFGSKIGGRKNSKPENFFSADGKTVQFKPLSAFFLILMPPLFALGYYATIIHEVGGAFRFSYPTYFYFVLAAAGFLRISLNNFRPTKTGEMILILVAAVSFGALLISQKSWRVAPLPMGAFNRYHFKIADALKSTEIGAKGTILCDAAGIIPYVSNFNQIDRVGLVDNYLSGRTPVAAAEREAYLWNTAPDVFIGYEPPAQTDATAPENDAAFKTPYVSQILMRRPLTLVESRIFVQDADLLESRMRELRDNWILVGEMDFPGWKAWKLKSFVYVRRDSKFAAELISKLKLIVKLQPEQIKLEDISGQ